MTIPFIGREKELQIIGEAITDFGKRRIIIISGEGGIGKTRLLQEVGIKYQEISSVKILTIIDFDTPYLEIPQMFGRMFAQEFEKEGKENIFEPYLSYLYLLEQAEQNGADPLRLTDQMQEVNNKFVECFQKASQEKRILIRFDTAEKIQESANFQRILDIMLQSSDSNIALLVAGRPFKEEYGAAKPGVEGLYQNLKSKLGEDVIKIDLPPFNKKEAKQYVEEKQLNVFLDFEEAEKNKIIELAAGKPILIDLAIELGSRDSSAQWLLKLNLEEIEKLRISEIPEDKEKLEHIKTRFEYELVASIAGLRTKLDELAILLAYIYPLDAYSVSYILEISIEDAEQRLKDAEQRVAFKPIVEYKPLLGYTKFSLHDAVRKLMQKYIVGEIDLDFQNELKKSDPEFMQKYLSGKIDSDQEREKFYVQRAVEMFDLRSKDMEPQIKEAQQQLALARKEKDWKSLTKLSTENDSRIRDYHICRVRMVQLIFRLDPVLGSKTLKAELKSIPEYGVVLADLKAMFGAIQEYMPALKNKDYMAYADVQLVYANQLSREGEYPKVAKIYEELKETLIKPSELKFKLLMGLGAVNMATGHAEEAGKYFDDAGKLAFGIQREELRIQALSSLAWASRVTGDLNSAIKAYEEVLKMPALAHNNPKQVLEQKLEQARAHNGISYIWAIKKMAQPAKRHINRAIQIRRETADIGLFPLGQSYATAGEVYCELEEPETALKYLSLASDIFQLQKVGQSDEKQSDQWAGKVLAARGRAYWLLATQNNRSEEEKQKYLEQAERDLQEAVKFAIMADLPKAKYHLGNVYSVQKGKEKLTIKTYRQSYWNALVIGDIFTELNTMGQLARMAVLGYKIDYTFSNLEGWFETYNEKHPRIEFTIFIGRFECYLGYLALLEGRIEEARNYLSKGLEALLEHLQFDWQLDFFEREVLPRCNPTTVYEVWQPILKDWEEHRKGSDVWWRISSWGSPID